MLSTEQLHVNLNLTKFVGIYIKYRKRMDYTYFKNYTPERQLFQDQLITNRLQRFKPQCKMLSPQLIFTCGVYGSGKSHTLKYLNQHQPNILNCNLDDYLQIDPDSIKLELPEASEFIQQNPTNAGSRLHMESGYLALILQYIGFDLGMSMIVDGSMKDASWYLDYIKWIKCQYSKYQIGIIKVECDLPTALTRCQRRGQVTGRIIPIESIIETYHEINRVFPQYLPLVDWHLIVDNQIQPIIYLLPQYPQGYGLLLGPTQHTNLPSLTKV